MARFRFIDEEEPIPEIKEDEEVTVELSSEELSKIRELLANADKLLALIKEETTDEDEAEEKVENPVEEPLEDEELEKACPECETEDEDEEVINTDKCNDSAASFGAIEKRRKTVDSVEDAVADAWNKRYNGR